MAFMKKMEVKAWSEAWLNQYTEPAITGFLHFDSEVVFDSISYYQTYLPGFVIIK